MNFTSHLHNSAKLSQLDIDNTKKVKLHNKIESLILKAKSEKSDMFAFSKLLDINISNLSSNEIEVALTVIAKCKSDAISYWNQAQELKNK